MHAVRRKRPDLVENIILHQDNAPAHKSSVGMAAVKDLGFEVIEHPPYSPDLAPCDFFLFPALKNDLRGMHFEDFKELKMAVQSTLRRIAKDGFQEVFDKWVSRWEKCVEHSGRYFEKE